MNHRQKSIVVTGAAGGIGQALVARFLQDNFKVWACDSNAEALEQLKSSFANTLLCTYILDIVDAPAVNKFFETIFRDEAELYCLINNAGIYLGKSIFNYSPSEIHHVVSVNCLGAVYCCQCFAQSKITSQKNGVIINISSVSGLEGSSDAIYGLSKSALIGLTKSCAMNFAPYIRVNAIAPGLVETPMLAQVPRERIKEYRQGELLLNAIRPKDIADTAFFLCSDESRCYTGAVFDLNNGQYRR